MKNMKQIIGKLRCLMILLRAEGECGTGDGGG